MSALLCTTTEAKTITGKDVPEETLQVAENIVQEYQRIYYREGTESNEIHSGHGGILLFPKKAPILTITDVTIDDVEISTSYIEVDMQKNAFYYSSGWTKGRNNIVISYTYGNAEPTNKVKMVIAQTALYVLANPIGLSTQMIGRWQANYGKGLKGILTQLPRRRAIA